MTDTERRLWFATYCEDLVHKSDAEIAYACARYRRDASNRFFPSPGQLLELCSPQFGPDTRIRSSGRIVDGVHQPWGGACQCDACMKKNPRQGFYHAPASAHHEAAAERSELDYWTESGLGYDPKVGDRRLDNTTERQRTPEELRAVLAMARARYPSVFGIPHKPEAAE